MLEFITQHLLEIIFGLISAGLLAFCKYLHSKLKSYRDMEAKQDDATLEDKIENHIEPIRQEIEQLRKYVLENNTLQSNHIELILASYKFRLTQLCKAYIQKGYMTNTEYEQLIEFYKVYHGLGGNGQAKTYYERAIALPIKDSE